MVLDNDNNVVKNNDEGIGDDICEQFESITNSLTQFKTQISMVQQQIKVLEKGVKKQMKMLQKSVI